MKQAKREGKSILLSAVLYALLLVLSSVLTLRGVVGEEALETLCVLCAALAAFVSALVHRCAYKDAGFLSSVLYGGGFFPLLVLVAFLAGGEISWKRVLTSLAAVAAAAVAANVLYAKSGFGRKKRGRARGTNR